jgi:hypothetical protein
MPFTAFQKLEALFTDEQDPQDLEDDPSLGQAPTDKTPAPGPSPGTKPHGKA